MTAWSGGAWQGSGGSVSGATLRERVGYTVTIYGREWVRRMRLAGRESNSCREAMVGGRWRGGPRAG